MVSLVTVVAAGSVLVVITVAGLIFNSYILLLSCTQNFRQTRTTTHLLLLHLGVINIFLALIFLFLIFPATVEVGWWGGAGSGCVAGAAWSGLHVVGAWTITALNVDKFVAIAAPLHYARFVSPRRVVVALAGAWVVAGGLCALPLAHPGLRGAPNPPAPCLPNVAGAKGSLGRTYAGISASLGYILPAVLVAGANLRILVIARQHRHRIVSALWDVTLSAQATITPQRPHLYLARYRGRSAAAAVLHPLATFLLLYLPAAVTLLYEAASRAPAPQALTLVTLSLLSLAPAVNGFVYGVRSKVLRHNFKSFLRKRLYRSEVQHEIQSRPSTAPTSRRASLNPSLTLPLPARLTRRMSEILIQPQSFASPSSEGGSYRMVGRRGSEASSRGKGSSLSLPQAATASPQPHSSQTFAPDKGGSSPGGGSAQEFSNPSSPPKSPPSRGMRGSLRLLGQQFSSQEEGAPDSGSTGSGQGGVHRSSLRRALFARNKQKSLDLEMTTLSAPNSSEPPRSASQQIVGDLGSPSLVRPLLLPRSAAHQGHPLSPARRTKRVSWSSDSFSDTPMDSDPDGLYSAATTTAIGCPPRYRKKAVLRHNGLRYGLSRVSLERIDSEDTRAPTPPSPSTRFQPSTPTSPRFQATTPPSPRVQPSSPLFSRFQPASPSSPLTTPSSPLVHPLCRPLNPPPPSKRPPIPTLHPIPSTPPTSRPLPSIPPSSFPPTSRPQPSTPPHATRPPIPPIPPITSTPHTMCNLPSTPPSSFPTKSHPLSSTPPSSTRSSNPPPPATRPPTPTIHNILSTPPTSHNLPLKQGSSSPPPLPTPPTNGIHNPSSPSPRPLHSTPPSTCPPYSILANGKLHTAHNGRHPLSDALPHA